MKEKKFFNKLVRDLIPEVILQDNKKANIQYLSKESLIIELKKKLQEEVNEFNENDSLEELADILEVIHGILFSTNANYEDLEKIRLEKKLSRGGFEKGIFLESVEI